MTKSRREISEQGSKKKSKTTLTLAPSEKPDFEMYESLEARIEQYCETEKDIDLLIAGLIRGDLVAGFSIGRTSLLPMFCIPKKCWEDPDIQNKIKSNINKKRVKLDFEIKNLGLLILNEIRRVQLALSSQNKSKPELEITNRVFDKLLENRKTDRVRNIVQSVIEEIVEAFLVRGTTIVSPMLDARGEKDLRGIVASGVGAPHLRAPDVFWVDLIEEIFKRYKEDGAATKRESLVSFFEMRSYPSNEEGKMMTRNAMNERITLAWNAMKRNIADHD